MLTLNNGSTKLLFIFFFSSRRRHTRSDRDWSSDVCSSDLRRPVIGKDTLVIGISQSGETRDTIQAMKLARELGARTVAITNMMGSQITREVDSVLYTRTGLEVGVAASKTFSAQVALLYLVGLKLAQCRGTLPPEEQEFIMDE